MTETRAPSAGESAAGSAAVVDNCAAPNEATAEGRLQRTHGLARLVLAAFMLTFVLSRILVILIMSKKLPSQLFFHAGGTHVHHLNYGICLLSIVGGYLIFVRPTGKRFSVAAIVYGIGLALTFDEFGMWLHLGGLYWQRSSFDAVITIAAALALLVYATKLRCWRAHHHLAVIVVVAVLILFGFMWHKSMNWANERLGPSLCELEASGPS